MKKIVLNIDSWISLLTQIDSYRNLYGSIIIKEWILYIENIKSIYNGIIMAGDNSVYDIFAQYNILDAEVIISLLKVIDRIYRFYDVDQEYNNLKEKFGIQKIAYLVSDLEYIKIPRGFLVSKDIYMRYGITLEEYDGYFIVRNNEPFIVDADGDRVLYTRDFNFNGLYFPTLEDMNRRR